MGIGIRVEIPEFTGSTDTTDFADWINAVEEILEYKDIPDQCRVGLVATRLQVCVAAWWQQTNCTRQIQPGQNSVSIWKTNSYHTTPSFFVSSTSGPAIGFSLALLMNTLRSSIP